jgi:N-acetylmuramoyl-L-alanine amidase/lysozyme
MIIDISHHQDPSKINYDRLAKQVDLAIIRTQYGSRTLDRHYKTHHREFQKRGVPTACYAWVRGVSINDMRVEATDFYNRTKDLNPCFWFLDVEEKSMGDMRSGLSAYVAQLRKLGAKKIGIYVAHHLYKQFNLNLSEVDAVWIPHYGKNDGTINSKPSYSCDIHQFTSVGRLDGYNGNLDLNRLMGTKPLEFFTGKEIVKEESKEELDTINVKLHGKDLKVEGICREGTNYIPVRFLERLGYKLDGNNNDVIIEYKEVK